MYLINKFQPINSMKNLIILISLFHFSSCFGQSSKINKESLYLIMSHSKKIFTHQHESSTYNASDTSFISLLLSVEKDHLIVVDTLNYDIKLNNMVNSVTHYDEFKFVTISEIEKDNLTREQFSRRDPNYIIRSYFNILDYSTGDIVKRKGESGLVGHGTSGDNSGFIINGNFMYVCKPNQDLTDGKSYYYITDKFSKVERPLTDKEWMENYYVKSHSGYRPNWYYNYVIDTLGNIRHRNSAEEDPYKWEIYKFDYPKVKSESKLVYSLNIVYNTNESKYLIGYKAIDGPDQPKGYITTFYLQNKFSKQWKELKKLPSAKFNVYKEDYLYGSLFDFKYIQGEALRDTIAKYEMRNPKKYSTKYATTPNTTFMTGKFFIYHVPTQRILDYKGQDIDTELLYIKDDWVYYRDFDKIKRIKLDISTFSLNPKSEETLCQDHEMIPNVHHIFWASDKPIKVEWLSPKPKNIK